MDDSRQFIEGRKPKENEKVPKHAPIGYCDSKLMNAVFARELATRYKVIMSTVLEIQSSLSAFLDLLYFFSSPQNIPVICICPGWCKTELARNVGLTFIKKLLMAPIAFLFMRSGNEGAQNIIHAVLEDADYFKVQFQKSSLVSML